MQDRTNEEWLRDLTITPPGNERAVGDLRIFVVGRLRVLFRKGRTDREHFVDDIAQETVMKVLAKIDTFRGESRFTTWVARIAINLAYTELRRRRWSNVSLEVLPADSYSIDSEVSKLGHVSPETAALRHSLLGTLEEAMRTHLTDYQRQVLIAKLKTDMPMGEVARRFGTNRNALYKVLHDARMKLKKALLDAGISADDVRSLR